MERLFFFAGTGFGTVSRYVISALKNYFDIDQLAINYNGDFFDNKEWPVQVSPAKLLNPQDPYGNQMFINALQSGKYDFVWIMNDTFVVDKVGKELDKVLDILKNNKQKVPTIVYYYPVDCQIIPGATGMLEAADHIVAYCDFGKEETLKKMPHLASKLSVITHGVDLKAFRRLNPTERKLARLQLLKVDDDETFVWFNANRNSPRKDLPRTISAFTEFRKQVPNSKLYLHTAIRDTSVDLAAAVQHMGLSMKTDVIFPANYAAHKPFPIDVLNAFYNCADGFITTTLGEGWGLSIAPSTTLHTPQGLKCIKDITLQDQVLTSDGTFRKILGITNRKEPEVYSLSAKYCFPTVTSDKHPYFATRDYGNTLEWLNVKDLTTDHHIAIVKPIDTMPLPENIDIANLIACSSDQTKVWHKMGFSPKSNISISQIQKEFNVSKRVAEDALNKLRGKIIPSRCLPHSKAHELYLKLLNKYGTQSIEPIKMNRLIPVDETFLEFIGWYLAEGSSENGNRIELSLHKDEIDIAYKFQEWAQTTLGLEATVEAFDNKARLRISSSIFAKFMEQECGKYTANKHVPSWLIHTPTKLGPLVRGIVLGDGHISNKTSVTLTSVSRSLAFQVRDICASVNILVSIKARKNRANFIPYVATFQHRERFSAFTKIPTRSEVNRIDCIETTRYFFVPIQSIVKSKDNTEPLWDICVEGTHSFVGNGVLLHNTHLDACSIGLPLVVPDNTCFPEQLANGKRGYLYPCRENIWVDNSGYRPYGRLDDIVGTMMDCYRDVKSGVVGTKVEAAKQYTNTITWEKIGNQWIELFKKLRANPPKRQEVVGVNL